MDFSTLLCCSVNLLFTQELSLISSDITKQGNQDTTEIDMIQVYNKLNCHELERKSI